MNRKYTIQQVENGYILSDQNDSCVPTQFVFESFEALLNHIGYPLGELELDESFVLSKKSCE